MELILAVAIMALGTLLNQIPFFVGIFKAKQDFVFLGVAHHAQDYFYYLSQFAMGRNHWFFGFDPLTTEFRALTPVGWPNIILGKLFSMIGIDHIWAYQLSVALFTFFFLFLCYQLITKLVASRFLRLFTLFLFVFTNGLPLLAYDRLGFRVSFQDFWFNLGNPLTRLGGVPHQLLANCAILTIMLCAIGWHQHRRRRTLVCLSVAGFILASLNPVQWLLMGIVLFAAAILEKSPRQASLGYYLQFLWPTLSTAAAGLPIALYLKGLFSQLPYSQLAVWETNQKIFPKFTEFIAAYGIIGILGIVGLLLTARLKNFANRLTFLYTAASFVLFYSPLSQILSITNTRFLSSVSIFGLAYCAATAVDHAANRLPHKKLGYAIVAVIVGALFIPAFQSQVLDKTRYFQLTNAYVYLPKTVLSIFSKAREVSSEQDAFLVIWPFNVSFAGLTGRREFNGHPLLTIAADRKDALAQQFFSGSLDPFLRSKLLRDNGITFVISYPWTFSPPLPFLSPVFANQALVLYKVVE